MEKRIILNDVRLLHNLIRQKVMGLSEVKEMGRVTGGHGYVLGFLNDCSDKDVFQKDLEKRFGIRRSTVTEVLNRMEKNGLIARKTVEYDSRLKKIELTEKGKDICNLFEKRIAEMENGIARALSDEEAATFKTLIEKLLKEAEK